MSSHEFNQGKAIAARTAAVAQVSQNAKVIWLREALKAIYSLCESRTPFTTDPIWAVLESNGVPPSHEPRAMGSAMLMAQRRGWCLPTDRTENSARVACHRRKLTIWQPAQELPPILEIPA